MIKPVRRSKYEHTPRVLVWLVYLTLMLSAFYWTAPFVKQTWRGFQRAREVRNIQHRARQVLANHFGLTLDTELALTYSAEGRAYLNVQMAIYFQDWTKVSQEEADAGFELFSNIMVRIRLNYYLQAGEFKTSGVNRASTYEQFMKMPHPEPQPWFLAIQELDKLIPKKS
jgi:hypothetical protein